MLYLRPAFITSLCQIVCKPTLVCGFMTLTLLIALVLTSALLCSQWFLGNSFIIAITSLTWMLISSRFSAASIFSVCSLQSHLPASLPPLSTISDHCSTGLTQVSFPRLYLLYNSTWEQVRLLQTTTVDLPCHFSTPVLTQPFLCLSAFPPPALVPLFRLLSFACHSSCSVFHSIILA